jgi:opacity protein-like surface antigen
MGLKFGEISMRKLLIAAGLVAAFATPALADTVQEVTTHGMVITLGDMQIDVDYTPDGKFTALGGQVTGTWRIDGDKLCTVAAIAPDENCIVYPHGKKSGDSFEVTGPQGSATVKIK